MAKQDWVLEPGTEYRFELDPGKSIALKLVDGKAELFGNELGEGITYIFGHECKAAIFTWQGCTLHVIGKPSTEYVSDETPMHVCMNLHLAFEQMRVRALARGRNSPTPYEAAGSIPDGPPRVLVLGPENAGKTTLCKILANYAVRAGQEWRPMYVNLDTSEGGFTVPGTISACPIETPIQTQTPANPLGSTTTSAPMALSSTSLNPLVYWFGHAEARQNPRLLHRLIFNLGENVSARQDKSPLEKASGIIIDTPSIFATGFANAPADQKYSLVQAVVEAFDVNIILVVGHEKLNVEMTRMFGNDRIVLKVPKSGGVVDLELNYRERVQHSQIHHYMYGTHLIPPVGAIQTKKEKKTTKGIGEEYVDLSDLEQLAPVSTTITFDDLTIYRVGGGSMAPSSALPIGAERVVSELQPIRVDPSEKGSGLLNAVLALLAPQNPDENERYDEELLDLPVSAFFVIMNLDMNARKMTVLMPSPGSVAGRIALMGSFEWQDS